ncbi:hypothetical protein B0T14DRAFT_571861 [Immersiella caudata]|uniref:Uncharacterized protein n=1 Tax=Immersiella caudata TaxID=314043 RepID=A0AA39U577_9PEZI|nr:hypothetical protein B0T14DRAFT_571861 [Immersiella caudata]
MAARRSPETTAAAAAGMASLPLSARFDDDQSVDIVFVDSFTLNQILEFIVDAHRNGTESILSLRCSVDLIRRSEYDYHSGTAYIDITVETKLHYLCQNGTEGDIETGLGRFVVAIPDATIRDYIMKTILKVGTSPIEKEGKILKQADISLGSLHDKLLSFVCEVPYSESRSHVER